MQTIKTIGLDIAKSVFQVHGIDAAGSVTVRRQLKRRYVLAFFEKLAPCLIGIEACASAHHWSRQLQALGHTVRLMPPAYVKPYVKRHKNDAADAEAICEAVTRANMRPIIRAIDWSALCASGRFRPDGARRSRHRCRPKRLAREAATPRSRRQRIRLRQDFGGSQWRRSARASSR
jgi:transposase